MKKKHPFLIFIAITGSLIFGAVLYIQSAHFAGLVKQFAAKNMPDDLGLDGDFSEFAIKLFPPGVSVKKPKVSVKKNNILKMPEGAQVAAERIDLNFRLFQMFTGNVRVHEAVVVDGDLFIPLDSTIVQKKPAVTKSGFKLSLRWDQLLQIRADAIVIKNTRLRFDAPRSDFAMDFKAESLRVGHSNGIGGPGYEIAVDLDTFNGKFPKDWGIPGSLDHVDRIKANATVNATGVQVDEIYINTSGLEAMATGKVKGNILEPKNLSLDGKIDVKGELEKVLKMTFVNPPDLAGKFSFVGRARVNLDKISETLKLDGAFSGNPMRFRKWAADQVRMEGAWSSSPKGGEITLSKAVISRQPRERIPGTQTGDGGQIEIGSFRYTIGSTETVTVPVAFDRAHIHWLGADVIKDVYPLNLKVSGKTIATYAPARLKNNQPWTVQGKLDLTVEDFQLDNQKLGVPRPLHKILNIGKIKIEGPVMVDPSGFRPLGVALNVGRSKFSVGGKVDFKTGYDLHATSEVNLEDIGRIAENDIRGSGTIGIHVHGPTKRVLIDFDTDLAETHYLKLNFGNLKGRITWDDDPQQILFSRVELRKGKTAYSANGVLDLGKKDTVSINFQVPQGDIRDFIKIFDGMVHDLWWFPSSMAGPVKGEIQVSGGITPEELQVLARLNGSGWEYMGERFKTVQLIGGYDQGKYHIADLKLSKRTGKILGKLSYDDGLFNWDFKTQDFAISDFDHVARLDVPMRGRLNLTTSGKGKSGSIESTLAAALTDFSVRGTAMPSSNLNVRTQSGISYVTGNAMDGQGVLDLTYNWNPSAKSNLKAELKRLDFTPVLFLLNSKLIQDSQVVGSISGDMNLNFNSGKFELASGKVELSDYLLRKSGTVFQLVQPVVVRGSDGTFEVKNATLRSNSGNAVFSLQSKSAQISGRLSGPLDVSITEFLTPTIAKASGPANLDIGMSGTIKSPNIEGKITFDDPSLQLAALESSFENISGAFVIRQNVILAQDIAAYLSGGRVNAEGKIVLFVDRFPSLSIRGNLAGSNLKFYPFQYVKVNGNLRLQGDEPPYLIDGSVNVLSALSKEKIMGQNQTSGLKALKYTPPATSSQDSSGTSKFNLKINAVADNGVIIQNDLFDAEMKGRVTVVNTLETPRILGTGEFIQGKMTFKDRIFQVQSANATFDSPTVINPIINLTAITEVNNTKVQLYVSGRKDKMKIDLSSNPVMPESEILSLLALGLTSGDFRKINAGDRTVLEQGEAASLLLHSLDFNREVQNKTGFQLQIDESVNSQLGTSIFRPQTQTDTTAAPRIIIKKQIGKRLDLLGGSTVGIGSTSQKEVNAELHVTPGFSVIGVWQNYEAVSTQDNRTSYGVDLKLQKRFK